jgi:AcrR family transcriptional regulator
MRQRDDTKAGVIFRATLRLVSSLGLAGVSMDAIARESGMATGTVYIYFKNKEELLRALYEETLELPAKIYFEGYDAKDPFKAGFKKVWFNMVQFHQEHIEELIFQEQYLRSFYMDEATRKAFAQQSKPLLELIDKGKKEWILKEVDAQLLLAFIRGFIREIMANSRFSAKPLSRDMLEKAFSLCWDGMKA